MVPSASEAGCEAGCEEAAAEAGCEEAAAETGCKEVAAELVAQGMAIGCCLSKIRGEEMRIELVTDVDKKKDRASEQKKSFQRMLKINV